MLQACHQRKVPREEKKARMAGINAQFRGDSFNKIVSSATKIASDLVVR